MTPKEAYAAFEAHWNTCRDCKLFALCGGGAELYRTWDQMPRGSAAAPLPKTKPTAKVAAPLREAVPTGPPMRASSPFDLIRPKT